MSKRTLLLNSTYDVIGFLDERKVIRFLLKEKAEILEHWEEDPLYINKKIINYPSIMKMKYYVKRNYFKIKFSRNSVYNRDQYTCQYCSKKLHKRNATIDHIIPKSKGGQNTFENCVAACNSCNVKKKNKTIEESGMKLVKIPVQPKKYYTLMMILYGTINGRIIFKKMNLYLKYFQIFHCLYLK